jgi:predicted NAD-dependent protein-ADP-ribosyltransferase YbiA (DUF1768 family)
MGWVLNKKFQDTKLKEKLLSTGDADLIENSGVNDAF